MGKALPLLGCLGGLAVLRGCWWEPAADSAAARRRAEVQFEVHCGPCHGADGRGTAGRAPPLAGSPWVSGSESAAIRIVLGGLEGPVSVGEKTYDLKMPGLGRILSDAEIAGILSYVRERFGGVRGGSGPGASSGAGAPSESGVPTAPSAGVEPAQVARVRAASGDRRRAWTVHELLLTQ
jgi:mono/diheme cytochrome c family protein